MEPLFMTVQFVLGLSVLLFLIWPVLRSAGTTYEGTGAESSNEKRMVIDALSDIEYEHETGKLNDEDYQRLRDHYLREAADVFDEEELEEQSPEDDSGSSGSLEQRIEQERERLT